MTVSIVLSVVAGSLLWLDRVFVFQFMISRPIILSPLLGLIMGNVTIGLLVGASLELLWLNAPPVGAYLPDDDSFCAAVATPAAICASAYMNDVSSAGFAITAGLPFAVVGRILDTYIRNLNQDLLGLPPAQGIERAIGRAMGKALVRSYLFALITLGICVGLLCTSAILIGPIMPHSVKTAFSYMPMAGIAVGLAGLVMKDIPRPGKTGLFILGMIIVLMVSWIL
ncbi:MAG TPA: PTS sugar transporter subunit IIC [Deltaproteobacteria bacterium]|nr:PTS sugar transporter subunit IIC [Deltaproteobacteria bacterium]